HAADRFDALDDHAGFDRHDLDGYRGSAAALSSAAAGSGALLRCRLSLAIILPTVPASSPRSHQHDQDCCLSNQTHFFLNPLPVEHAPGTGAFAACDSFGDGYTHNQPLPGGPRCGLVMLYPICWSMFTAFRYRREYAICR